MPDGKDMYLWLVKARYRGCPLELIEELPIYVIANDYQSAASAALKWYAQNGEGEFEDQFDFICSITLIDWCVASEITKFDGCYQFLRAE